ncbi:MAG TPA: PhnD/SsuA/transferrin family substrate-binding protein, partial [Aestuariivirgaceae bacterium]|nr:PhnD/SsuA/transferrin family substrate-binding protein [Aestuariivirgaceae bacterium]
FFGQAIESGGHAKSLEALQAGRVDVCAIDSVCVAIARRHRPELLDGIVAIGRSPSVPGLPYVTLASREADEIERMRQAVADAFADPALARARSGLFLKGFSLLTPSDYAVMRDLERDMTAGGGLSLWSD